MKHNKLDYYIFIEELNKKIIKNLINIKRRKLKLYLIIPQKNFDVISKFAKIHKIPFYLINNINLAIKNKAYGIFLTSNNKILRSNIRESTKLKVIGSAHNQLEYYIKKKQNCTTIMLSPIFYNKKYSHNKILNPIKFNLTSLEWKSNICALGGINSKNVSLIGLTKVKCIGFKSLITC